MKTTRLAILQRPGYRILWHQPGGCQGFTRNAGSVLALGIRAGLKNAYESIKAFSETDFTEDLKKFDIPTLIMHGEDDQIVAIKDSAKKSARLIKGAPESIIRVCPTHGLTATH